MLVPQVLGHFRLESGLQHRLGQPGQQAARADQPDALLPGLLQQLLRQLLLIDDLARRHGLDHHTGFQLSRVRHGPFLSIGPNLTHRFFDSPFLRHAPTRRTSFYAAGRAGGAVGHRLTLLLAVVNLAAMTEGHDYDE